MVVGDKTSPFLTKEMGVALVYAAGIWGLPAIHTQAWTEPLFWGGFGIFFLLATINLLEFSIYEVEIDEQDGHTSFVRALGKKRAIRLVAVLLGMVFAGLIAGIVTGKEDDLVSMAVHAPAMLLIFGLMALVLLALLLFPKQFGKNEAYRTWGDGAFLLPFLSLWLIPA